MWKPSELEAFSMLLDAPMKALEMRIMLDIVRRIKINGEITRSADWQINRLSQLGMARDEITSAIQQALGYSDEDMRQMYEKIIGAGYARDEKLYTETGTPFIPFAENENLQQLISSVAAQTNETLKNITQSLGFAARAPDGRLHFTELADYYQKTLDGAVFDIASGAFDYNTVLKRVVREMTNSGLRTVDYASGHSNRVEVAARRAVMTGLGQLTDKVNNDNAEALGTDTFEISWHTGARPTHWWGGMWFTSEQLVSVCHYGEADGLCGVNCYHDKTPVIPGLSEPSYTKEELAELNAKEKEKIAFGDKEYNKYEATQRQRRLETTMRAQRQEIKLLKEGGADEDSIIEARARYRKTSDEYARFSKAMELPQQRERVTVDGLGNIGQGKYTGGSGKGSPVKVPPVGSKVTDKVTAEERRELLTKPPESGIIKSIRIDDLSEAVKNGVISEECKETIFNTLREQGVTSVYDEVRIVNFPRDKDGKIEPLRTNAVATPGYPKVYLEINEAFFGGKTKDKIEEMFMLQKYSVSNSLEDAVIHECGHAKVIRDRRYAEFEAIDEELKGGAFTNPIKSRADKKSLKDLAGEISEYAQKDGLECIAECHVMLHRGDTIPEELKALYDKYIR